MNPSPSNRPIVFYDGGCSLCRREIAHYRKLDSEEKIDWVDIHADPEAPERLGIAWHAAMERIHVQDAVGKIQVGAPAFLVIWEHLPGYRGLAWLLRGIPGLVPFLNWAYRHFARWRWARRCREGVCGS